MKNILVPVDTNTRRLLFTDALLAAFQFRIEQSSGVIVPSILSFSSVLIKCLVSQSAAWNIILKEKVFENELEYYEFSVSLAVKYPYSYIWIKVSLAEAMELFKEYKIDG